MERRYLTRVLSLELAGEVEEFWLGLITGGGDVDRNEYPEAMCIEGMKESELPKRICGWLDLRDAPEPLN